MQRRTFEPFLFHAYFGISKPSLNGCIYAFSHHSSHSETHLRNAYRTVGSAQNSPSKIPQTKGKRQNQQPRKARFFLKTHHPIPNPSIPHFRSRYDPTVLAIVGLRMALPKSRRKKMESLCSHKQNNFLLSIFPSLPKSL